MHISRRHALQGLLAALMFPAASAAGWPRSQAMSRDNFYAVYHSPALRDRFFLFLQNVFNLYPERDFDAAIAQAVGQKVMDRDIYLALQKQLPDLKPVLADVRLALPALRKQKRILADQTRELVGERGRIDGYLEFGSGGRYLDALEELYSVEGERFFVSERAVSYGPVDLVDRGQLFKAGADFPLNHYAVQLNQKIALASLDMVTVYIGFHHCRPDRRAELFADIRSVLRPGGLLVVRDHDVRSAEDQHLVALAHDVFNLGTQESWAYNDAEFRAFYALDALVEELRLSGFSQQGRRLFQDGDPTQNALMLFVKK